jgi:hypothetical protein
MYEKYNVLCTGAVFFAVHLHGPNGTCIVAATTGEPLSKPSGMLFQRLKSSSLRSNGTSLLITTHKGTEGGWESQIPSMDTKQEVL